MRPSTRGFGVRKIALHQVPIQFVAQHPGDADLDDDWRIGEWRQGIGKQWPVDQPARKNHGYIRLERQKIIA